MPSLIVTCYAMFGLYLCEASSFLKGSRAKVNLEEMKGGKEELGGVEGGESVVEGNKAGHCAVFKLGGGGGVACIWKSEDNLHKLVLSF